jgi:hypothetical protein
MLSITSPGRKMIDRFHTDKPLIRKIIQKNNIIEIKTILKEK